MNLYFSTGAAGKLKRKVDTMLEKVFKLSENKTTVKTEVVAGLTTFMTMAYIIALNPNLLTGFGAAGQDLWNGVFLATCIASAIGTFCMAFLANKPFAMAPGMGLNSFFAVVVGNIVAMTGMTYVASFQAALVIILLEGIVFVVLSIFNVREKIVEAIPLGIRLGISPAIGLMLMNIGLGSNVGVYAEGNGFTTPFYVMRDFFGALTPSYLQNNMGDTGFATMILTVVTMFVGLFVILAMSKKGIKGSVLYGMLVASVIYWIGSFAFLHTNPFASLATASFLPPFADMAQVTLFKFNFAGFMEIGWFTAITLIITFCIIDMFDTIGTLVGTASRAGMVDEKGDMPNMKEALLSDDFLVAEQRAGLQLARLPDEPPLDVFAALQSREQPLLVLELHVGRLHADSRGRSQRSRHVERPALSKAGEILLQAFQLLPYIVGHLLNPQRIGAKFNQQFRYFSCHVARVFQYRAAPPHACAPFPVW